MDATLQSATASEASVSVVGTSDPSAVPARRRRKVRAVGRFGAAALATATVLAGIAVNADPASAATYQNSGSPGSSGISQTAGGYVFETMNQYLVSGPVTAHRTAASTGTQRITITWRIWQWEYPNWHLVGDRTGSITYVAHPGQYVAFNGFTSNYMPSGIFSTDLKITWRTSGGAFLGSRFYDLVHRRDYACFSTSLFCGVLSAGGQWSISLT